MNARLLAGLCFLATFAVACGDDTGGTGGSGDGSSSAEDATTSPASTGAGPEGCPGLKPTVGACDGGSDAICREVTNPGLDEATITSSICKPEETYVDSCDPAGVIGKCIRFCGEEGELVNFNYSGDPPALQSACELSGIWVAP